MAFEKGDRVSIGSPKGLVYGTILDVAPDGEPKIQLDNEDDAMYYPVTAVAFVEFFESFRPDGSHPLNKEVNDGS